MRDVAALREEYRLRRLRRRDLESDPFTQFNRWLAEAVEAGIKDPNAMSLATVNAEGRPSVRIVLLKGVSPAGFLFFTNYLSRKAADLEANSQAALNFFWADLERQIAIEGTVQKATREEAEKYFHSRPRESQLGAWASHQSQIVPGRDALAERFEEIAEKFRDAEVPLPDFWGGYWLAPSSIEFWQGGPGRLHDRLRYRRAPQTWQTWLIERLSP